MENRTERSYLSPLVADGDVILCVVVEEETGAETEGVQLAEAEVVRLIGGVVVVCWFWNVLSGVVETLSLISLGWRVVRSLKKVALSIVTDSL